jgi:hypothetical protein
MSTTSTNAPSGGGLTLSAMLKLIQDAKASLPVVFYIESEYVPKPIACYQIPSDEALSGFDLVCHPDHVGAMKAATAGCYLLMPMTEREWQRRNRLVAMKMWSGGK